MSTTIRVALGLMLLPMLATLGGCYVEERPAYVRPAPVVVRPAPAVVIRP